MHLRRFDQRSSTGRLLVWLLMALAPMQGMAAGMAAVLGPLHMHLASAQTLVLEDVRRAPVAAPVREIHVATAIGHIHGSTPQRHLHGRGDASVMPLAGDALQQAGDADEAGASASAAAFFGILPTVVSWLPSSPRSVFTSRVPWSPQTHQPDLPERPPRRG